MIENQELIEQAVLGKQVEEFFNSDIGKYLLAKAEQEYILALQELAVVSASDVEKIRDLQTAAKVAVSIRNWLGDAVITGLKAHEILEERE